MHLYLKWKNFTIYNLNNNITDSENSDGAFHVFSMIFSCIEILLSCLICTTLIFYKKKLSRIDLLTISKYIFSTFIFSLFLYFSILKQIYTIDDNYNYCTSTTASFYVTFLCGLQISISFEHYKSIRNPCYVMKYMINNSYNISKHFIASLIASIIISLFPYFFQNDIKNIYDYCFTLTEDDYFDITLSKNKILSPIIIVFFLILLYLYFKIKLFYGTLKEKSLMHLKYTNYCLLLINISYLISSIILLFLPFLKNSMNISKIIQVLFFIISISDSYLQIFKIFHSGFYYYYLSKTFTGILINLLSFGCCFRNYSFPNNSSISSLTTKHTKSIYNFYSYLDYIIEDYILDTFDFMLQAISAGLSLVYKDFQNKIYHYKSKDDFLSIEYEAHNSSKENNNSSSSSHNEKNFKSIININELSDENNEKENSSNSSTYNFFKVYSKSLLNNQLEDDLFSFNYCGDASIIITPLFVKESIESMNLYKINKIDIINSLLSHKFMSLLMTNSKKIYFKKLNNLIIKTYDNKLLIELHTDIKIDNNSDLNELLTNYFFHMNYSNINSFLCVLIGVFKVKINDLKEILIFVSKNPFIEDVPKNFYFYWELMRFNNEKKKFNKVLSSKDGDSFIIETEEETLSLTRRNNNIFKLEDFEFFKETIKNDLKFLKSISSSQFCLIILYYEVEAKKDKLKDSIFSKFRIKLINDSNSISDLFKFKKLSLSNSNFSSSNNTEDNNNVSPYKNISNNNIFDDTDKEIFISSENKKKIADDISDIPLSAIDLINANEIKNANETKIINDSKNVNESKNLNEKKNTNSIKNLNESKKIIMKYGFESSYNNYKGILYFKWENVFYQNKKKAIKKFYSDYAEALLNFFSG